MNPQMGQRDPAVQSKNFTGRDFINKAAGFEKPTQLPRDDVQRHQWQVANKAWWESTPMRYDWRQGLTEVPGSPEYFKEIDRRFLSSVQKYMPWRSIPFEQLIAFNELHNKDVLEIGVGQGTHAQLIAPYCKSFTGIDLTAYAAEMTFRRFEIANLRGNILRMDAEEMAFPDGGFDFIWSWGVIHHSADTRKVLTEMYRVLRPGGQCCVMIYHRSWWSYWVYYGLFQGVLMGKLRRKGSVHHVTQSAVDGAIARYYTSNEWRAVTHGLFKTERIRIYGLKTDVIPLPHGRLKSLLEPLVPDQLARFFTNQLQMGSFLVAHIRKA
jgi:ubiquinone/menaquinone biosynthesis C-methylase UbiE